MFTFRPNKNGNGHKNGNGNGYAGNGLNGNGNGNGTHKRFESVLGPGLHYKGTVAGAGGLRIEGAFDGDINIQGALVIADGARVTADVRAGAVSVAGSLKGNITSGKVEILSTGRIWGDLVTTTFATEEGAFLRGQVRMEDTVPVPAESGLADLAVAVEPADLSPAGNFD
jgi:cytoskeletal protein CcmA (bactofilin family)